MKDQGTKSLKETIDDLYNTGKQVERDLEDCQTNEHVLALQSAIKHGDYGEVPLRVYEKVKATIGTLPSDSE